MYNKYSIEGPTQDYNKYIADQLQLSEVPNFLEDSSAIKQAEALIEQKGLKDKYVIALENMARKSGRDLSGIAAEPPSFKALAMVQMFRKISESQQEF